MNPAWWAVIIAAAVAVTGWAGLIARLLWTGRGLLDSIRADLKIASIRHANLEERLDQHLAWHEKHGGAHALLSKPRQWPRKPG